MTLARLFLIVCLVCAFFAFLFTAIGGSPRAGAACLGVSLITLCLWAYEERSRS